MPPLAIVQSLLENQQRDVLASLVVLGPPSPAEVSTPGVAVSSVALSHPEDCGTLFSGTWINSHLQDSGSVFSTVCVAGKVLEVRKVRKPI